MIKKVFDSKVQVDLGGCKGCIFGIIGFAISMPR